MGGLHPFLLSLACSFQRKRRGKADRSSYQPAPFSPFCRAYLAQATTSLSLSALSRLMIILLTAAAASAFVAFVSFLWSNRAKRLSNAPALATAAQPGIEKTTADRAPGIPSQIQITPDGFFRPDPHPHTDLRTAMTRNFLYACNGLRYPYRMSMAHKQLHVNDWLEIDNEYEYYRARTTGLMEEYGASSQCKAENHHNLNALL